MCRLLCFRAGFRAETAIQCMTSGASCGAQLCRAAIRQRCSSTSRPAIDRTGMFHAVPLLPTGRPPPPPPPSDRPAGWRQGQGRKGGGGGSGGHWAAAKDNGRSGVIVASVSQVDSQPCRRARHRSGVRRPEWLRGCESPVIPPPTQSCSRGGRQQPRTGIWEAVGGPRGRGYSRTTSHHRMRHPHPTTPHGAAQIVTAERERGATFAIVPG